MSSPEVLVFMASNKGYKVVMVGIVLLTDSIYDERVDINWNNNTPNEMIRALSQHRRHTMNMNIVAFGRVRACVAPPRH